jgi:hypothetical protein
MSESKRSVFSDGDVIRLVNKPQEVKSAALDPADFEGVLSKIREQAAAANASMLTAYQYKALLSTADAIESNLTRLRTLLGQASMSKPWYYKLMFWRKN